MAGIGMGNNQSDEIIRRVRRFVDEYGWNWGIVRRHINGFFGTAYTAVQLKKLYIKAKRQG